MQNNIYSRFADTRSLNTRIDALGNKEALRIAVIPWIVGRVFWDYVDSVINLSKALDFYELKPVNRRLRELFDSFEQRRKSYINEALREMEEAKAEELQEVHAKDFNEPYKMLREHISLSFPGLSKDIADYLAAVYMAIAVGKALGRYCYGVDRDIEIRLGLRTGHSILPSQITAAKRILYMYLGDHDTSLRDSDINEIANGIYEAITNLRLTFSTQIDTQTEQYLPHQPEPNIKSVWKM